MSDDDCKYFVKCFLNFLRKQITERNFSSDVIESIEVAAQCLEAAYDLPAASTNPEEESATADTATGAGSTANKKTHPDFDLFQMFQTACIDVLPDRKERAEEVKNEGNRLMKDNKFSEALLAYNKAISLDATNAAFYCNRAAAYIRLNEYEKSVADCTMALLYNPKYSKAYGRMGIAYSNLHKFEEACEAYKKAIELEPNNQDYQNNLRITEQQNENWGQQILDQFTVDNPDLRNIVMEMVSDPMISIALGQMSRNSDGLLDISRQVASRMANQFPEVLTEFRSQLGSFLNTSGGDIQLPQQMQFGRGGGVGGVGATDRETGSDDGPTQTPGPQQPPPPPPPSSNNEDGNNRSG